MKKFTSIFLILTVLLLIGCNNNQPVSQTPEQAIEITMKAIKEKDAATLKEYYNTKYADAYTMDPKVKPLVDALTKHLSYKITNVDHQSNKSVVSLDITNIDLKDAVDSALQYMEDNKALSQKDQLSSDAVDQKSMEIFMQKITVENPKLVTTPTQINLTMGENIWQLNPSEEFENALIGGGMEAFKNFQPKPTSGN